MTNTTQTATAIARLMRMLNDYQRNIEDNQMPPDPPAYLEPPKRADIILILNVIKQQQARIVELKQRVHLLTAEE